MKKGEMMSRTTLSSFLAKKPGKRVAWRWFTVPLGLLTYPFYLSGGVIRSAIDNNPSAMANRMMWAQSASTPAPPQRNYAARRRSR